MAAKVLCRRGSQETAEEASKEAAYIGADAATGQPDTDFHDILRCFKSRKVSLKKAAEYAAKIEDKEAADAGADAEA